MTRGRALVLTLGFGVSACGANAGAPVAPEPARRTGAEFVPPDLDAVVLIDTARIRAALPEEASARLTARAFTTGHEDEASLVTRAALLADRVHLGFRIPDTLTDPLDNVVVLEGDFSKIPATEIRAHFLDARPIEGGFRVHDVARTHPPRGGEGAVRTYEDRRAPARLYSLHDRIWIFASPAEIDAVDRVIERGSNAGALSPAARGVVSLSVRARRLDPWVEQHAPRLTSSFRSIENLSAWFELRGSSVAGRFEFEFVDGVAADRAREAFDLFGRLVRSQVPELDGARAELTVVERTLVVETELSEGALRALGEPDPPSRR